MALFLHYLTMPYLLKGIVLTLQVTALGLAGGLLLGAVLAAMQLSRAPPLAAFARGYAIIFRGTPLILQMVFAYDALPRIGLTLPAVLAGGLALAFNEAPFIAEMIRASVLGVDRGQTLAGQALGMTPWVLMRRIVAPQAIRIVVPAFGNEAVSALKNSSLASTIAVQELTLRSTQLASSTFDFFSIFFAAGLVYLVLTGAISGAQLVIERWLDLDRARRGRPTPTPAPRAEPQPRRSSVGAQADRAAALRQARIAIEARGLSKRYQDRAILQGLDLAVREGEVVALLGPSGSGKSTLLRCLNHLEGWEDGEIRIGGRSLGVAENGRRLTPHEIALERARTGVGMVFQQFNLFGHLTALENIAGPLRWVHGFARQAAEDRARELLDRVGLADRADALPRHLSGGQQQRVAIARALAARPSVLLLDEPTSALDPELVGEVLETIRALALDGGLTMVISTHQIRFAYDVADRVIFLSGGAILEEGPPREVLKRPRHPAFARFLSVMETTQVSDFA
jgi:polar amino acid transport system permease protein